MKERKLEKERRGDQSSESGVRRRNSIHAVTTVASTRSFERHKFSLLLFGATDKRGPRSEGVGEARLQRSTVNEAH